MERQIGAEVRYLTGRDVGGALPHGWALEVSQGYYTPILGDQIALSPCRTAYAACVLVSKHLALVNCSVRSSVPEQALPEQMSLF